MDTERTLADLRSVLERQLDVVGGLRLFPTGVLHQRPAPERWNVAEILEHMDLSSGHYIDRIERIYSDPDARIVRAPRFKPGRWGEFSVKAMRPDPQQRIHWRMKTLRMFEPQSDRVEGHASLDRFEMLLCRTLLLLDRAEERGWDGPRVTSTLGPVLRFKLCDAFRFPIAHQERHMLQIARTLEAIGAVRAVA